MFLHKSGFTLIELLVVIAVIGISVSLAVPSWGLVSQKRSLTNAAEQVAAFLATAQTEAQKRNQEVSLAFTSGDSFITFDPVRGILQPVGDKLQLTFESTGGHYQLRLSISPTGLMKICNPTDTKTVGGYAACPI